MGSAVDHPDHYNQNAKHGAPECIDVVEQMTFNVGNAVKYVWRYRDKGKPEEDLEKALWYLRRELACAAELESSGRVKWPFPREELLRAARDTAPPLLRCVLSALQSPQLLSQSAYVRSIEAAIAFVEIELVALNPGTPTRPM